MSIENTPNFNSPRVTEAIAYDYRDRRHLTHTKHLLIDGKIVYSESWYEDDDWANCSDKPPELYSMYKKYLSTLRT